MTDKNVLESAGLDMRDIELVVAGSAKLSFDYACAIVNALGVSFDFMLSRNSEKLTASKYASSRNLVQIAARDGSYLELSISDSQLSTLKTILKLFPDASSDL